MQDLIVADEVATNIPAPEFPLVSNLTVVEALLTSGLRIPPGIELDDALSLINAVVVTVQSSDSPPPLKLIDHNVDINAHKQMSKGKKARRGASQDDAPEEIKAYAVCANCRRVPTTTNPTVRLLSCENCKSVQYCGPKCQIEDWMAHKNLYCVNPAIIPAATLANPQLVSFLRTNITNPFARLEKGIWLHDRHKLDVFALLIDSFRLREADDFVYADARNNESIYNGRHNSFPPFCRYIDRAEAKGLMPPWWTLAKRADCENKSLDQSDDNYQDIHIIARDIDIIPAYKEPIMLTQLRMFAESVMGEGPAGTDGNLLLQKMVVAEEMAKM